VIVGDKSFSACFEFNDEIAYDWSNFVEYEQESGELIPYLQGGSRLNIIDDDEPTPIYRRGLYFDGINDFIILQDFSLTIQHTVEFWLLCWEDLDYTIFSISLNNFSEPGSEEYYKIAVDPT
jgi:hypothetical protein